MESRNRFQGINSASICSLAGRYDNPIPTGFLAPIDCLKIPALDSTEQEKYLNTPHVLSVLHEQLIPNTERFKRGFAKKNKKQIMIDLRGISTNWFKEIYKLGLCFFDC
jgi:hypothetical protein